MPSSSYAGFDAAYRSAIEQGHSRSDSIRYASRIYLEYVCNSLHTQISAGRRDRLITEALKTYDSYRYKGRSHALSYTAAKAEIKAAIEVRVREYDCEHRYERPGGRYERRTGGGGGGLDDMDDVYDALPRSSRGAGGQRKCSSHSSAGMFDDSDNDVPRRGGQYGEYRHPSGGVPTYSDGTPLPPGFVGVAPTGTFPDGLSDEDDSSPRRSGRGHRSYSTREFRPSGGGSAGSYGTEKPDYFSSGHSKPSRPSYGSSSRPSYGASSRGYNTRECRPSGSSSFGSSSYANYDGDDGVPLHSGAGKYRHPSGRPTYSDGTPLPPGFVGVAPSGTSSDDMDDEFPHSSGSSRHGYNTREYRPSGASFGFGQGSGSESFTSTTSSSSSPPPRRPSYRHQQSSSDRASASGGGGFRPSAHAQRRPSTDSHYDLSDSDSGSPPRGGQSRYQRSHSHSSSYHNPDNGIKPPTCFYKVLGLQRGASAAEIKTAYRKMSMKYHPDRAVGADKSRATQKMAEINQANDVLGDEAMRWYYDMTGCVKPSG